jgi:type IV secretion system protein TrbH
VRPTIVAAALPLLLAACGSWPAGSYVQSVTPTDAAVLAPQIALYLAGALPAGSAIAVAPAQAGDPISAVLSPNLDRDGFNQTVTGTPVRYVAAPLDGGIMLRVSIADRQGASQFFSRTASGAISPAGPLTVAQP